MTILTSRPDTGLTDADMLAAVKPTINLIEWISSRTYLPDGSGNSVLEGKNVLEELISCFDFFDTIVMPIPSVSSDTITYDVAIKPFDFPAHVAFKAVLRIKT